MNREEIIEALKRMDCSTARGRRELDGREIVLKPQDYEITRDALARSERYIRAAKALREVVSDSPLGITEDEIEAVEFVIEQIEAISRIAHDTAIKNY